MGSVRAKRFPGIISSSTSSTRADAARAVTSARRRALSISAGSATSGHVGGPPIGRPRWSLGSQPGSLLSRLLLVRLSRRSGFERGHRPQGLCSRAFSWTIRSCRALFTTPRSWAWTSQQASVSRNSRVQAGPPEQLALVGKPEWSLTVS